MTTLWLTLQIAVVALLVALPPCVLVAYWLARHDFPGRAWLSALITLPLVLPPTAVGYLLLRLLAADGPLGSRTLGFDLGFVLTWRGAVLAAAIMAAPLIVRTARVAFEGVDPRLETMARTLGHRPIAIFLRFSLPLAKRGLIAAAVLGFTRAVGEFGATLVVAGSIPGRTQTLASAIYRAQQVGDSRQAYAYLGVSILIGIVSVVLAERLSQPPGRR